MKYRGSVLIRRFAFGLVLASLHAAAQSAPGQDWTTLDKQAEQLYTSGDLKEAIRVAKLAVAAASGPAQSSRSLDRLGFFEYTAGALKEAEPDLRKAFELRKATFGVESAEYAESANDLALFCRDSGKLPEGRTLAEQAVDIRTRKLANTDLRVAESLNTLASIYGLLGEYDLAISRFEQARSIHESQTAPQDLAEEYGTLCINLAGTYQRVGKYGKAEELFDKGLAVLRVRPGINHPAYSASLVASAYLQAELGHYPAAEKLYAEAGELLRKQLGEEHRVYATYLNNRAALYAAMGNVAVAEADYRKALELKRKIFGPDALTIGASLRNLARIVSRRDPAEGEKLFQEAADLYARNKQVQPYDYGSALLGLAEAQRSEGKLERAQNTLQQASDIVAKGLGTEHPLYAAVLHEEGVIHQSRHEYTDAENNLQQAVDLVQRTEGDHHPDLSRYLYRLALVYDESGDYRSAEPLYRRSLEISDRALTDILSIGSESSKDSALANLDDPIPVLIAFQAKAAKDVPDARVLAFEAVARRKGRVLDQVHNWTERLSGNSDPSIRERFRERQAMLECEASLSTAVAYRDVKPAVVGTCSLPGTELDGRYERLLHDLRASWTAALGQQGFQALQVLREHIDAIEAELSRDLPQFASAIRPVQLRDIAAELQSGELLVEIVAYPQEKTGPSDRYGAFLLDHSGNLEWLDLASKSETDRAVRDLFAAANDWSSASSAHEKRNQKVAEVTANDSLRVLSRNLNPLIAELAKRKDIQHLRVAPDGMLNLVPFGALADSAGNRLIERDAVSYLSSSRDLVSLQASAASDNSHGKLVIALSPGGKEAASQSSVASSFRSETLERLTNAQVEARQIKKWIPEAELLGEGQATEERIKQLRRPALLHIVGHGLVKGNENCQSDPDSQTCGLGSPVERVMSLSAIVLEEAYGRAPHSTQDGLLTALELQTLNLQGSEMLVLSQCRMADGVPSSADGVFGMRRAAAIAGVKTFVAPLWKIADEPQQILINRFYEELNHGSPRDEALRRAKLQLLHAPSTKFFLIWAPVILSGDPRPVPTNWFKGGVFR
ncbi:MAG TPA: CHAT domain-containing tetratricopeptide repeat protein [Terriglobales bacterium]|nr:CHAT domain-containing tetratricopeptide repeat protein [Terriglobales bacterium]